MKELWKEFKNFIQQGNVIDLAVAVIIGGAFQKIVSSLVSDIIMPLIGVALGGLDFSSLAITIGNAKITYGNFINNIINFLIIAIIVFLLVKAIRSVKRKPKEAEKEPTEKDCPYCFTSIPIKATRCPNCTSQLS
jgi:large conductance mechanosensitive channel